MKSQFNRSLINLPPKVQMCLYLIREELKSRKLFQALHDVGLEESCFQPNLDSVILNYLEMDDGTDETFRIYNGILERRSRKMEGSQESIMKQTHKAFQQLLIEKEKMKLRQVP